MNKFIHWIALSIFLLFTCGSSVIQSSSSEDKLNENFPSNNLQAESMELIDEYEAVPKKDSTCSHKIDETVSNAHPCPRKKSPCGGQLKRSSCSPLCDLAGARRIILIPPIQGQYAPPGAGYHPPMPYGGSPSNPMSQPVQSHPIASFHLPSSAVSQTPFVATSSTATAYSSVAPSTTSTSSTSVNSTSSTSSSTSKLLSSITRPSTPISARISNGTLQSSLSTAHSNSSMTRPIRTSSMSTSTSSSLSSSTSTSASTSPSSSATSSNTSSVPLTTSSASVTPSSSSSSASSSAATSSTASNTSNNTTNNTDSSSSSGVSCSFSEFTNAVTGNGFPTPSNAQYTAFINGIGNSGISTKRELAMFLAEILQESDGLQATEEYACKDTNCPGSYDYSPDGTHHYYGRGYIQLTWSANYGSASTSLYGDANVLLNNPEAVATDQDKAWAVSFWYWKERVHSAPGVTDGQFGAATKAINGALECSGGTSEAAKKRFTYYTVVMKSFNINETPNESGCYN